MKGPRLKFLLWRRQALMLVMHVILHRSLLLVSMVPSASSVHSGQVTGTSFRFREVEIQCSEAGGA